MEGYFNLHLPAPAAWTGSNAYKSQWKALIDFMRTGPVPRELHLPQIPDIGRGSSKRESKWRELDFHDLPVHSLFAAALLVQRKHPHVSRRGSHSCSIHRYIFMQFQGKSPENLRTFFNSLKIMPETFSHASPKVICNSEDFYPLACAVRAAAASTGFKQNQGSRFSGSQRQRISTLAAKTIKADKKKRYHKKEMV